LHNESIYLYYTSGKNDVNEEEEDEEEDGTAWRNVQ
jgi:hypothetical protein